MTTPNLNPRIYVACLSSYNAGKLHGEWIDAAQDVDAVKEEIAAMLKGSPCQPAEEYAIHDSEAFGEAAPGEYDSIDDVVAIANLLEEHGGAFAAFVGLQCVSDPEDLSENFRDAYSGVWGSEVEFAENLVEEGCFGPVPDGALAQYIDFDAIARDLFIQDYTSVDCDEGVYVFRNC